MKRLSNYIAGGVSFSIYSKDNTLLIRCFERACFGGSESHIKHGEGMRVEIHFPINELQYTIYDMEYWTNLLTESGFPCKLGNTLNENDREYLTLEIQVDEYINKDHVFAGMTAARYPGYTYAQYFPNIPEVAAEIKLMFPDEESFNCLMLAHFPVCEGYFDSGHGLPSGMGYKLIGKEIMLERFKTHKRISVNSAVSPVRSDKSFEELHNLTKSRTKEAYEQAFQILK